MKKQTISVVVIGALLCAVLPARAAAPGTALTPEQQAVHVLNRVAFGPKPGDIERVTQMGVQRYIEAQLHPEALAYPAALTERLAALETVNRSAGDVVGQYAELQKQVRDEDEGAKQKRRLAVTTIAMQAAEARLVRAIDSPRQLEEVMVDFWYNHFNVFAGKGIDRALVPSYERDAIRPYVLGSFRDLLGATAKHPAMLYYLDNYLSTSADYTPGKLRGALGALVPNAPKAKARGLNENFARELMELHTLGVDTGYVQKDVTELARMLTGWTYDQRALVRNNQTFRFDAQRHDQGVKHWLGRDVPQQGQQEGEMALDVLAMHPATAHHLSYKLAQYFVQDNPPPALVDRMARTYLDSKGDIRAVLGTLFASAEFMAPAALGAKFKTPYQFVVSAARASAAPVLNVAPLLGTMTGLGMPLYGCQTPDGYKNTQDAWLNPDALTRRITFATALAAGRLQLATRPVAIATPRQINAAMDAAMTVPSAAATVSAPAMPALDALQLQATLGGAISPRTLSTVAASAEPLRAAMLLGSPDFMQH
ncbi:MAG: DUF1800 domain-containing protein [Pseudomonadota bacterium]|nr:DUF1800 domain-containing protein [Pseudomonadota bacterium]